MFQYQNLIFEILREGEDRKDRTGVGTRAIFNKHLSFRMDEKQFPLMTLKETLYKGPLGELAGFIRGSTDEKVLADFGCNYWKWNLNAPYWVNSPYKRFDTDLGKLGYSYHLRNFDGIDQLRTVMDKARTNPTDRRLLVSHWHPAELHEGVLPACHYSWQIFIHGIDMEYVSLIWNQRSVDVMLGLPADFVYYGALLTAIANELGKQPFELACNLGDTHIYHNHIDEALDLAINGKIFKPPTYVFKAPKYQRVEDFLPDQLIIKNYKSGPFVKLPMAV